MGKNLKGKELGKGISQRKDGRYEARAVINGTKIDIYNVNLSQLKKDFEIEKAKAIRGENIVRTDLTFKQWYDEWFKKSKAPQLKNDLVRNAYNGRFNGTICKIFGDKRIVDISQLDIQEAVSQLSKEGYSSCYIKKNLNIAKECFDSAVANRIVNSNPCFAIKVRDDNKLNERRVMDQHEQDLFLLEARNSFYYECYAILLLTGMRIGEFGGLWWEDIDFENKCIRINRSLTVDYYGGEKYEFISTPKTRNSYRTIPFFEDTEKYFRSWKVKQDDVKKKVGDKWRVKPELGDLVFTNSIGSPLSRSLLSYDIDMIVNCINMKECYNAKMEGREFKEFKKLYPHAFRHTFATRCFEKGLDPLFVQSIMGHSSYQTTVSYTHLLDDIKKKNVSKAGKFLDTDTD